MRILPVILLLSAVAAVPVVTKERLAVREVAGRAASGDAKALYDLAMLHDMGYDSIPVDSARSTALYRLSAERGYAPAQNYLGFRYFNGEGVGENVDSALYWLAKAAGNGDAKAANNLGYLLANSDKVSRDYARAIRWLTKAAEANLPTGMSQLADLYRQGLGCDPDTARAEELYVRAIQHGLHDAELKLLNMKGRSWEVLPPDTLLKLGKYHYTHGAPLIGVTLFRNVIGEAHGEGTGFVGTSEDKENNEVVVSTALALLGDAYSRGQGVDYDHDRSVELYYEAAQRGNPSAAFVIAELLDIFPDALRGFPEDSSGGAADYWYEKAALQGVRDADTATTRLLY